MRIAVIGSGISGLTAAYLLHKQHEVHVFEKEQRIGGHTHTFELNEGNNKLAIDTGFIVFNDKTYPGFNRLLDNLGIAKQKTNMSFSVSNKLNGLEYNGTNFAGLFAQKSNLINFKYLNMLASIARVNKIAKVITKQDSILSLEQFIKKHKINAYTAENYLLPMCCAIWSCERKQILATPAKFVFDFLNNHGMLNINDRPQWFVVKGGSFNYVRKLQDNKLIQFHKEEPIVKVMRESAGVKVISELQTYHFDKVIMATHADDTLKLLSNPKQQEINVLSCFPYQYNSVTLHTDVCVLPRNKSAWACWNYMIEPQLQDTCSLSYNMNLLQNLSAKKTYCVSINQNHLINKELTIAEFTYAHPIYTKAGFNAQKQHLQISGQDDIYYCGAYWGYGFHEDGVQSALHISEQLGGSNL